MEALFKSVGGNLFCSRIIHITGYYFNNNPWPPTLNVFPTQLKIYVKVLINLVYGIEKSHP